MRVYVVSFKVPWVHGWQRAGVNHYSGDHYTRDQTDADELEIALAYQSASKRKYGRVVKAPPWAKVTLLVDAYQRPPKRWPKYLPKWLKPHLFFIVKPDADNISKLMDGLNGVAWVDDAQVTDLRVKKHDRENTKDTRTNFTVCFVDQEEPGDDHS